MRLDLGSLMFNLKVKGKGGNPSWGTALGQGKGYLYTFEDKDSYFRGMKRNSIDYTNSNLFCPLGKGGNKQGDCEYVRAAKFDSIYVRHDGNDIKIEGVSFVLLEIEQKKGYHKGRKILKYSPKIKYKSEEYNKKCFDAIEKKFNIKKSSGWFVSDISIKNDDELYFTIHVITDVILFKDIVSRKCRMLKEIQGCVSHYTTLSSALSIIKGIRKEQDGSYLVLRASRSDCLNDPNECIYVEQACKAIFKSRNKETFLLSFCKSADNPVMWRLYNSSIELVFDKSVIMQTASKITNNDVEVEYGDVSYYDFKGKSYKTQKEFQDYTGMSANPNDSDKTRSLIKHIDYEVENEWRIILLETKKYIQPTKLNDIKNGIVGSFERYGMIKIYREMKLPLEALSKIRIYEFSQSKFELIRDQLKDLFSRMDISIDDDFICKTECAGIRH